jgi:hypothetical protein
VGAIRLERCADEGWNTRAGSSEYAINGGLNVVEQWNSANDFVFFARRDEMTSNRREDHEISVLALHLLQNCMVYVNTLMVQQVLARPHWTERLTARDLDALTPLIWDHVNPYGRFDLDMEARLPIDWPIWRLVTRLLGLPQPGSGSKPRAGRLPGLSGRSNGSRKRRPASPSWSGDSLRPANGWKRSSGRRCRQSRKLWIPTPRGRKTGPTITTTKHPLISQRKT